MIISIASDHAGFEQKQLLAAYLEEKGYEVHDLGPDSDDRVDYPDFAAKVAHEVAGGVATYLCAARESAWPSLLTRSTASAR